MTGGTTWADMPFHMNIVASFLYGANQEGSAFSPLASVFYSNSTLAYPYLPDFHTAYNVAAGRYTCRRPWRCCGVPLLFTPASVRLVWGMLRSSLREATLLPGAMLLGSFLVLLYSLGLRLCGSAIAACAAVPVTLFTGGIGAYSLYKAGWNWTNFMMCVHCAVLRWCGL